MNYKSIQLAESVSAKVKDAALKGISGIEKDILLEDLRNLYRDALQFEVTEKAVLATPVQQTVVVPEVKVETIEEKVLVPVVEEVKPEPVKVESVVVEETKPEPPKVEPVAVEEPVVVIEPVSEVKVFEPEVAKEDGKPAETLDRLTHEVAIGEEPTPEEPKNTFSASIGIGGEEVSSSPSSLNEYFKSEENTINTSASSAVRELHSVVASSTFSGLLDLNKRILFTKELFNGNSDSFASFIQQLDRCAGMSEAKSIVNTNAMAKQWKGDNDTVKQLVKLVMQHFEFR